MSPQPQQAGCEMLKCARQRGVGRRVAGSVILCRCLVTTPAAGCQPAPASITRVTCHVASTQHTSSSIIPSPAGEQTPRLFKDWVSVSAGTQITNCSSHTFLRPRPGWEAACAEDFHLPPHTEIINTGIGHEQRSRTAFLHCISQLRISSE